MGYQAPRQEGTWQSEHLLSHLQRDTCNVPQTPVRVAQGDKNALQLLGLWACCAQRVGMHARGQAEKLTYLQLTKEGTHSGSLLEACGQSGRKGSL